MNKKTKEVLIEELLRMNNVQKRFRPDSEHLAEFRKHWSKEGKAKVIYAIRRKRDEINERKKNMEKAMTGNFSNPFSLAMETLNMQKVDTYIAGRKSIIDVSVKNIMKY